jgi:hypothetical protein
MRPVELGFPLLVVPSPQQMHGSLPRVFGSAHTLAEYLKQCNGTLGHNLDKSLEMACSQEALIRFGEK